RTVGSNPTLSANLQNFLFLYKRKRSTPYRAVFALSCLQNASILIQLIKKLWIQAFYFANSPMRL
ncbi:hypothetical protein, partial [Zymomonas mobilis]|uniref:hypothetical protein n=1 Tax=Zymomonas mobilis TaxID=542 RepID=UPI000EE7D5F6